jgi:hypothetical protein
MVKIYSAHLTFYNISNNRSNPYPFASHPGNSRLDIFSFPLRLKNYSAPIAIYIGTADIGYYLELLAKLVNHGLLDQFRGEGEPYSSFDHLVLLILFLELKL